MARRGVRWDEMGMMEAIGALYNGGSLVRGDQVAAIFVPMEHCDFPVVIV